MDETPQQRTGAVLGGGKVSLVPFNLRWAYGPSNMLYVIFVHVSIWSISDHSLCLMLQPWWFGVSPLFCICMFSHMVEAQGNRWPLFLDLDFGVEDFDLVISISALPNLANLDAAQLTHHHPSLRNRRQPLRWNFTQVSSHWVVSVCWQLGWFDRQEHGENRFLGRNIIGTWSPKGHY